MKLYYLLLLLIITTNLYAQSDSSNNSDSKDTLRIQKTESILLLKSIFSSHYDSLKLYIAVNKRNSFWSDMEEFSKDEINSGLSREELAAYKKNKERLLQILADNYESKQGPEFLQPLFNYLDKMKNIAAIIIMIMSL